MHPINLFFHVTGIVIWVGGMFFAWMCLRPVAAAQLQPPVRLTLWVAVFRRFFPWVWVAVGAILSSGLHTLVSVGMANAPWHWHAMLSLGLVMSGIFIFVVYVPYRALRLAVAEQNWPNGGVALGQIRKLIGTNLTLGLLTIVVATLGRLLR
jgi:uncharacterized membrane protein